MAAKVSLIRITEDAEHLMGYCARVSNPQNQDNPDVAKLLLRCYRMGHWSVFEMAHMTLEIETSRAVARQILRHGKGFDFQEFSLRYSEPLGFESIRPRRQDEDDRQGSHDDLPSETIDWWNAAQTQVEEFAAALYARARAKGIAKESARFLLPDSTTTRLYVVGPIRSWIHYVQLRGGHGTQAEHTEIANAAKAILISNIPSLQKVMEG